jgi:hypothetical protein
MKKLLTLLMVTGLFLPSCKKSDDTATTAANTFEAKIDGQKIVFNVTASHLIRSAADNEKRLDITGTSTDGSKRITLTLGEETSIGNGVTVKKYILNAFPEDDPNTPNIDESLSTQGFSSYGISLNGNWLYNIYNEAGSFTVTSCNSSSTIVSGTFETTLTDMNDNTIVIHITEGKMNNIKYTLLN